MGMRAAIKKLEGMMRVGEAAEYLGVCTETLRNWDKSGKLVSTRHPVNGYRYYSRSNLDKLIAQIKRRRHH